MKGLRLARDPAGTPAIRTSLLARADDAMRALEACKADLAALRAQIHDAELTSRNEELHDRAGDLAARVQSLRTAWWEGLGGTKLIAEATVAEELARELPR